MTEWFIPRNFQLALRIDPLGLIYTRKRTIFDALLLLFKAVGFRARVQTLKLGRSPDNFHYT